MVLVQFTVVQYFAAAAVGLSLLLEQAKTVITKAVIIPIVLKRIAKRLIFNMSIGNE
jgi:hypothetical protein